MKRISVLFFAAVLAAAVTLPLFPQQNPFLSTGKTDTNTAEAAAAEQQKFKPAGGSATGFFYDSALMQRIRAAQKSFQAEISDYITRYKTTGDRSVLSVFLLFSFLYGLLHVLGPGHRKIFLFTYFVTRPSKWKQGMLAGFMTAVLHAVSAVVFIGGLYLITSRALMTRFNNITPVLERISYGAIILLGIYLIIHHFVAYVKGTGHGGNHSGGNPDTLFFVLASGLIPCPGAATIMIFSIAVGSPSAGIYSVAAMSLGMGTVLTLIPPAAGIIRNRLNPLISGWKPGTGERIHDLFSVAGAVLLILFGLFFII